MSPTVRRHGDSSPITGRKNDRFPTNTIVRMVDSVKLLTEGAMSLMCSHFLLIIRSHRVQQHFNRFLNDNSSTLRQPNFTDLYFSEPFERNFTDTLAHRRSVAGGHCSQAVTALIRRGRQCDRRHNRVLSTLRQCAHQYLVQLGEASTGFPKICRRRQHLAAAGAIALWNIYHCPRWPELRIFHDVVNAVHRSPKHIRFVSERSLALFERERCRIPHQAT